MNSSHVGKVIIVDDHSDEVRYISKAADMDYVEVYRNKKNVGQGISRNIGFMKSKSDKVMFLDDDVLVSKDSLVEIDELLDKHDSVIYTPDKHKEEVNKRNFWITGNFFAFKREKFKDLGGFKRFRRREDLDLVLRAIEKKFRIIGYSEGIEHMSTHNSHTLYDEVTNVIFNIIYFNLPCMRFQLIHKPIRLVEILTGWKCPFHK